MKKPLLLALLLFIFTTLQLPDAIVGAEDEKNTNVKQWEKKFGVAADKEWNVAFNTKMNASSFTSENVYVLNNETEEKHPISFQLSEDQKVLTVTPEEAYELHETYILHIGDSVVSTEEIPMGKVIEMPFFVSKEYVVADMEFTPINSFDRLKEAVDYADEESHVVLKNGKVTWAKSGIVRTDRFTNIYSTNFLTNHFTYVAGQSELEYISSTEQAIGIRVAGKPGYVSPDDVSIIPTQLINDQRSYYKNIDEELYHYVFANGSFGTYKYGKAPDVIDNGEKVYSWDGKTFKGETYSFFNQMNLREESSATAEQLDAYIKAQKPDSPLIGLGETFVAMQEKHQVNAVYLMAHAIHESAWGMSEIAQDKNNLYGINATDSNPYGNADTYKSYEASVQYAADFISSYYLTEGNWRYHGMYLGNKNTGMNVRYASDPFWGQKIAGHMYRAEEWMKNNSVVEEK
ncbi:N-acetylglucosaminidase [Aquibacillus albus]|uniref:Beta-N-acetylglucosaminidase n=1 Tax=Aquibacillus albus TaxID=1168171 RepID=A0ABS2MWM4_9BACI|nr:glucosaminidase domain-containing protein [Aquibacillus albus]MBM7570256.1 beta-N-acetylglucosaminidase [Aquibacillus albus]